MRRGIAALAIAGAGAAGLGLAAPAHATIATIGSQDDWSAENFRDELRYSGLGHETADNAFDLAMRVCGQRSRGYSSRAIERAWMADPYYTSENAVVLVLDAEYHFCSMYEDS